jgi:phospholipase C
MSNFLGLVDHFVVLMLENHSFDQMLGYSGIPGIDGLVDGQLYNQVVDTAGTMVGMPVRKDAPFVMAHDPGHEFMDVRNQLWGPQGGPDTMENVGFVYSYAKSVGISIEEAKVIMSAFTPDRLPVLTTLAKEFAVFDQWFSSMPGPTWPNRFFIHAATSGGLIASPDPTKIVDDFSVKYDRACIDGFDFRGGTIYEALERQKKKWRIYHGDHMPQVSVLRGMIPRLLCSDGFRQMEEFARDVESGDLPEYTFIEPNYGNTQNFTGGNSQHPVGDIRDGERLIKSVYEALRGSKLWPKAALVVLYDEHGGFFDHVKPPATVPTGDDDIFNGSPVHSEFQQLGIRVPVVVASPLIARGVIDHTMRDHASLIATVGERFGLDRLTKRDKNAKTFENLFSLPTPRQDTPTKLPEPPIDAAQPPSASPAPADVGAPLDSAAKSFLHLAKAIDLKLAPTRAAEIEARVKAIKTKAQASAYIAEVEDRVKEERARCKAKG